jgi:hypothetical protein
LIVETNTPHITITIQQRYALAALLSFAAGTGLFGYGIASFGLLSKNKIAITTLATTGPDFGVEFGYLKLWCQLPDTALSLNVGGIMVRKNAISEDLGEHLSRNPLEYSGDDFVITERVVGVQQSDNPAYHPLVEILGWRHINTLLFWLLATVNLTLFLLEFVFYHKYKKAEVNQQKNSRSPIGPAAPR